MSTLEMVNACREWRELKRMTEEIAAEMDAIADKIKNEMGDRETMTAGEYKINYKTVVSSRLDSTALKKELPDIAARFTKMSEYRRFQIV